VIPDIQPIAPPSTVPSTPQRVLPTAGAGAGVSLYPAAALDLQYSLGLIEEYTDNFNLTKDNRKSNLRSALSPGLVLNINSALTKGVIAYTFSPSYDTATSETSLFHSLLGQVVWQATPLWQLTVADSLTRSDEPGEADRLGLRQQRRTFTANTFSLTSDYLLGLVTTRQSYRLNTFIDDNGTDTTAHILGLNASIPIYQINTLSVGYEYLNSDTEGSLATGASVSTTPGHTSTIQGHQFNATVSRQTSAFRTVGLNASYAFRTVTEDSGKTDFRLWSVSAFTRYAFPGRWTSNTALGVTGVTSDSEQGTSATGLPSKQTAGPNFFSASSLSYQFGPAVATLALDAGFSETFSTGQDFGVVETQGVSGSFTYAFTPWLTGIASGMYRRNKPTGIGNQGGLIDENQNYSGSLALTWRIHRRVLLDLSYTYFQQIGSDGTTTNILGGTPNQSYTQNRVQASLRVTY
jgi:hypothetical protein